MSEISPAVLLVDDDEVFRTVLARELTAAGLRVTTLERGDGAVQALACATYDVVVLDLRMPGVDGLETLKQIKAERPLLEVILLTGHGSVESAVEALKLGAYDFLTKPCDLDHLEATVRRAAASRALQSENETLRRAMSRLQRAYELIGSSPATCELRALVARVAPTDATVLIRGESGTGKEVVARLIHRLSPTRRERPFVVVDCTATDENLALSELFGHERGAYTGATERRPGAFELADQGTIFIDEIGDAKSTLQASLLRVLETGAFRRVGGDREMAVDVRVIAATHRDLEAAVREGRFREDLLYRLNVISIPVPPLRDRRADIPELTAHLLAGLGRPEADAVSERALDLLTAYAWPGNVRELRNVLERAAILAGDGVIDVEHLPGNLAAGAAPGLSPRTAGIATLEEIELRYVLAVLERCHGDRAAAAAGLGISERTLYRRLRAARALDRQT